MTLIRRLQKELTWRPQRLVISTSLRKRSIETSLGERTAPPPAKVPKIMSSLRSLTIAICLALALPGLAFAQESGGSSVPSGTPQRGVDVPVNIRAQDSQRTFMDQSSESSQRRTVIRRSDGETPPSVEGQSDEEAAPAGFRSGATLDGHSNSGSISFRQLSDDQLYNGLIPGTRDEGARLPSLQGGALTWFGLQLDNPTRTRVAFRLTDGTQSAGHRAADGSYVITIRNTSLQLHRLHRQLDARHFNRRVRSISVVSRGNDIEVRIVHTGSEAPTMRRADGFLFVDFAERIAR